MRYAATIAIALILGSSCANADMHIYTGSPDSRATSGSARKAPEANFTGEVWIGPSYPSDDPLRPAGTLVAFRPGARTAWHSHPAGQILIVKSGTGWIQTEGGPKQQIKEGDVVWTPAGVRHWHGATATEGMTHIAITAERDGRNVDWLQHVSDEHYVR